MALKFERVLEMSLDECIQSFKIGKKSDSKKNTISNESKFKEGRREQKDDNDDDDDDDEEKESPGMSENFLDLDKETHLEQQQQDLAVINQDLRLRITENLQSKNRSQWRLARPNTLSRSADMTLGLVNDECNNFNKFNNNKSYYQNYNGKKRNYNQQYNGRIQRFSQNYQNRNTGKNIKSILEQLHAKNPAILYPNGSNTRDMTVQCPSRGASGFCGFSNPSKRLTTQQVSSLPMANRFSAINRPTSNENVKTQSEIPSADLLSFNDSFKREMMPHLASKFLDFLKSGGQALVHKPLYDMKIQKEIHEIQKKPLLYKCPGGEVISSDGAGVNCKIQPQVCGISLNNRFA